ncbi:LLM class flavin-dependent oxidoreductase [Actinoplanes sp. Pm04-4]|uniref:LLM class flavin-dependent oxidoreductase n=1 Tax=Paractinoplanes pyxinae TaxID=2997416 RepID=A0ABT4AXV9_9ACTN|nr:LLM class flavin-dependent oxidoreductase [Actinoplanes pyxinae]MCY1139061.1 LLM class flavin-dependent oxidoreductase [Actinoplanes pyxinae]
MHFGLGLPITDPRLLIDWARRAEACGFDTLALLDRLVHDNPEPLVALSVLAGATSRIRLQTEVLLGPLRASALLAKQVATLDVMSGGRFTLGIGIGVREDDYTTAGVPFTARGRRLDAQLTELRQIWRDGRIGPRPATPAGPPILIGAFAPAALRRVARHGEACCARPLSPGPAG